MLIFDTPNNIAAKIPGLLKIDPAIRALRYIAPGNGNLWKTLKLGEARTVAAYKGAVKLGLIYETNGRPRGAAVGRMDGQYARKMLKLYGVPKGGFMAYTSDEDRPANMAAVAAAFEAFFNELKDDKGEYLVTRVCYGAGATYDYLAARGLIDPHAGRWVTQSMGFQGSRHDIASGDFDLRQLLSSHILGLDVDRDLLHGGEEREGFFVPWGGTPENVPTSTDLPDEVLPHSATHEQIEALQEVLNTLGYHLAVDGVYGGLTTKAVEDFQRINKLEVDGLAGQKMIEKIKAVKAEKPAA